MSEIIQALKRVTLSVTLGHNENRQPISFTFIYGLAAEGLNLFEVGLLDKGLGEKVVLTVPGEEAHHYFGHLFGSLRQQLGLHLIPESIYLQLEVTAIERPADAEVVKALAKSGAGCGGSCDCGCG